jgi:hypothetical protein
VRAPAAMLRLLGMRRARLLSGDVLRFQARSSAVIWVLWRHDGWWAIAGSHGWLHGTREHALDTAKWLSENLGLPIRETRL